MSSVEDRARLDRLEIERALLVPRVAQRLRRPRPACGAAPPTPGDAPAVSGIGALPSSPTDDAVVGELGVVVDGRAVDVGAGERPVLARHPSRRRPPAGPRPRSARSGPSRASPAASGRSPPPCRPRSCSCRAWSSIAEPFGTSASTSAIATRIATCAAGQRLGHGQLVEVARVVVVDRDPEQVAQVPDAGARGRRGPADRGELREHVAREVGRQAPGRPSPAGRSPSGPRGRAARCAACVDRARCAGRVPRGGVYARADSAAGTMISP